MMTTPDESGLTPSDTRPYLVLAALADGERVDPSELRSALEDPAARDYLVAVIAIRHAVRTVPLPSTVFRERRGRFPRARWWAAAALVAISLTTGYVSGHRAAAQAITPPKFETAIDFGTSRVAVPEPTRVVSLQPGVNWKETIGGR
jgi:hypothetical protein